MKISNTLILFFVYVLVVLITSGMLGLYRLDSLAFFQSYDTVSYVDAKNLLFSKSEFHATRCFAYPVLLGIIEFFFESESLFLYVLYVVQLAMLWVVFLLHYRWLALRLTSKISLLLSILLLCNVTYIVFSFIVLTEISCLFFLALSFEMYKRFRKVKHTRFLFIHLVCLGIAVLLKPGLFLFLLLLLGWHILNAIQEKNFTFSAITMFFALFITIGIQFAGMYRQFQAVKLSYIGDITMYRYMNTSALARQNHLGIIDLMNQRDTLVIPLSEGIDQSKRFPAFSEHVTNERNDLLSHSTVDFFAAYLSNLFSNFHTGNTIVRDLPEQVVGSVSIQKKFFDWTRIWNMIYLLLLVFTLLLFLIEAFNSIRTKERIWSIDSFSVLLFLFCGYAFLISGVSFFQGDRFNVIWMPFLAPAFVFFLKKPLLHGGKH